EMTMLTLAQASTTVDHALAHARARMVLAGIVAATGLLADPGQAPADPPVARKATASTAAAHATHVSAPTRPRPAYDISVSIDGRIFMMMADVPWLVESVNG